MKRKKRIEENKESIYSAQRIRDYFNTPEWHKIKKKNGFI
jgi:hypothetical protein